MDILLSSSIVSSGEDEKLFLICCWFVRILAWHLSSSVWVIEQFCCSLIKLCCVRRSRGPPKLGCKVNFSCDSSEICFWIWLDEQLWRDSWWGVTATSATAATSPSPPPPPSSRPSPRGCGGRYGEEARGEVMVGRGATLGRGEAVLDFSGPMDPKIFPTLLIDLHCLLDRSVYCLG